MLLCADPSFEPETVADDSLFALFGLLSEVVEDPWVAPPSECLCWPFILDSLLSGLIGGNAMLDQNNEQIPTATS